MEPQSLVEIVSEEEFLCLIQESYNGFIKIYISLERKIASGKVISKKFYSTLKYETDSFESFLDEHGARENKSWAFFSEYVASIRNLSIAAFYIRHILDRYPYYKLRETPEMDRKFKTSAEATLRFLNSSIYNLFKEAIVTAKNNGLEFPPNETGMAEYAETSANKKLPRNISEEDVKDEEERIVDLCEKIRNVSKSMLALSIPQTYDPDELQQIVPSRLDEKVLREFLIQIHNVQSEFDTYVKNTKTEQIYSELKYIRGYISMPLHLLESALWLSHMYERHEEGIRPGECKRKISMMADKNDLLNQIVNFAFYYALYFIQQGACLAEEVLPQLIKFKRIILPIPTPLGFHARPSTYLSLIARKYDCDLFLVIDNEKYNARSVMSMLQAGGVIADKGIQSVQFESDQRVINDLEILAKNNYCEEKPIPPELNYLRSNA
ncbi:MAG: hypothetical protein COV66_03770 [Nitrospinae bacterium CG11_big_fil_rev_8_21_14_0_20_45_15]|nr:MAG: hypothetical protein COV66_03770 [Nitrospinae bacterium CG11_big_fil_rev_8_21_14_0_20_45_15]